MRVYPLAKRVKQDRTVAGVNDVGRSAHRGNRVKRVCAVAVDDGQIPQASIVLRDNWVRGLFAYRHRYPVAVVLYNEYHRQPFSTCSIQGFKNVTFGAR